MAMQRRDRKYGRGAERVLMMPHGHKPLVMWLRRLLAAPKARTIQAFMIYYTLIIAHHNSQSIPHLWLNLDEKRN